MENALRVLLALGGSTNAVIHLTAIAGRAGVPVSLQRLNELSDTTPVLVNLKPVGNGYMEDFFAAGGVGALLRELRDLLHLDCLTVTGETLGERLNDDAEDWVDRTIIAERKKPLEPQGGLVALFGNLAPKGAILKRSAADSQVCSSTRAGRWCSPRSRISPRASTIPSSTSTANDILVLQNAGPHSAAAMPEAGYLPIPKKLAAQGRQGHGAGVGRAHERHRVRHHRAARDAGCGQRRPARPGSQRRSHPPVGQGSGASISWSTTPNSSAAPPPRGRRPTSRKRGYARLYAEEILGADEGCDFAFLRPR